MRSAIILVSYCVGMTLVSVLTLHILEKAFDVYDKYKSKKAES
jgi:NADH:ubiquinone oxidoreductase subunit H